MHKTNEEWQWPVSSERSVVSVTWPTVIITDIAHPIGLVLWVPVMIAVGQVTTDRSLIDLKQAVQSRLRGATVER
jgi:hypothetical protein